MLEEGTDINTLSRFISERPRCRNSIKCVARNRDIRLQLPSVMPAPKPKNELREVGRARGDRWERFDRLQRNLRPFLCRKPKGPPIERFRSYTDLEDGRSDTTT